MEEVIGKRHKTFSFIYTIVLGFAILAFGIFMFIFMKQEDGAPESIGAFMLLFFSGLGIFCMIFGVIMMRKPKDILVLVGNTLINKIKKYEIQLADIASVDSCFQPHPVLTALVAYRRQFQHAYIRIITYDGRKYHQSLGNVQYAVETLNKRIEEYRKTFGEKQSG